MTAPYPGNDARCPWFAIRKCPLYIESHDGRGLGCVDDMARPCRVSRGEMNYHQAVIAIIRAGIGIAPEALEHLTIGGRS